MSFAQHTPQLQAVLYTYPAPAWEEILCASASLCVSTSCLLRWSRSSHSGVCTWRAKAVICLTQASVHARHTHTDQIITCGKQAYTARCQHTLRQSEIGSRQIVMSFCIISVWEQQDWATHSRINQWHKRGGGKKKKWTLADVMGEAGERVEEDWKRSREENDEAKKWQQHRQGKLWGVQEPLLFISSFCVWKTGITRSLTSTLFREKERRSLRPRWWPEDVHRWVKANRQDEELFICSHILFADNPHFSFSLWQWGFIDHSRTSWLCYDSTVNMTLFWQPYCYTSYICSLVAVCYHSLLQCLFGCASCLFLPLFFAGCGSSYSMWFFLLHLSRHYKCMLAVWSLGVTCIHFVTHSAWILSQLFVHALFFPHICADSAHMCVLFGHFSDFYVKLLFLWVCGIPEWQRVLVVYGL